MSWGSSWVSDVILLIRLRNGRYSPNGTSRRFRYTVVGPLPGSHSRLALRIGSWSTAPTRMGRSMALAAFAISS